MSLAACEGSHSFWVVLTHGKLGRADLPQLKSDLCSFLPVGGPRFSRMVSAGSSAGTGRRGTGCWVRERLIPVQSLQGGQWESCTSRGGQKMSERVLHRPQDL